MREISSILLSFLLSMSFPAQGGTMDRCMNDTIVLEYHYTYDAWGRPLTTTLSYNGEETVTIEDNTYDALGRLSQTTRNSQSGLTTQYAYNIRDWVTQIASPVFVENLYYNTSTNGSTPQWGGNISSEEWKAGDDFTLNKLRSYNFAYDGVDRLLSAAYFENAIPKGRYSTQYTYDQMGNILTLKRYGLTDDGGFGLLDDLSYDYSGNQLVKVTDSNIDEPTYVHAMHFTDGADEDVEYEYNANGSLTADLNKGITGITYNAIGLPEIIMWNINKSLSFAYAADGRKLRQTYFYWRNANLHGGGSHLMPPVRPTIRTTDYCGPFIYETSALQDTHLSKVLFDGGYITPKSDGTAEYHFYVKDHLGNIRAVVSQNDSIEEINHYYPYGSLFGESTGLSNETQPYKYNAKELDRMHGLDMYDYGARLYDPVIARWGKMDNFAEKYYSTSSYAYCANTPLNAKDWEGNLIVFINGFHNGFEGASSKYWGGFDKKVQDHFNDYHTKYYDGSLGGILGVYQSGFSRFSGGSFVSNFNGYDRFRAGYNQGQADAMGILLSLTKDKQGNYSEVLRIVSHSMGGTFSKGFLQGIIDYASKNKIDISTLHIVEYDFAPFHPENQQAIKGVKTYQYSHVYDGIAGDKRIKGAHFMQTESTPDKGHSITDFWNYIMTLPSGTYELYKGNVVKKDE